MKELQVQTLSPFTIGAWADDFHWNLAEVLTLRGLARSRNLRRWRRPKQFRRF